MSRSYARLLAAATLLLLAGCAGVKAPPAPAIPAPPGEQAQPPAEAQTPQAAAESAIAALGPRPPASETKAVLSLLDAAHADEAAARRDTAEAALERALRIEPRNPWLWLELAQLRLAQGQYAQAITLARKSNSFAAGKHRVQAENWLAIAQARVAQGDTLGADQAFRQAAELARQARGE